MSSDARRWTKEEVDGALTALAMATHRHPDFRRDDVAMVRGYIDTMAEDVRVARAALEALSDPEGHIWHGGNTECTGECKDVRAALARIPAK
jgi:hypothetical protein